MTLKHAVVAFAMFLGAAAVCGLLARPKSGDKRGTLHVDGRERTYTLHVSSKYDGTQPVPLVVLLHGRLGTGEGQERLSHFDKISDEHGFLAVYPDGLNRGWADGRGVTPGKEWRG